MKIKYLILLLLVMIVSCSKKHHPQTAENGMAMHPAKIKTRGPLPKVLTVDDKIAGRAVDGRLYFDLEGHRYWKNYKDGKYYMFSKSMYNNPAFKPNK
jgi:hypothetical protein